MALGIKRVVPQPAEVSSAAQLQAELARELRSGPQFKLVCGVALAYERGEAVAHVAAVVASTSTWAVVHAQQAVLEVTRPREADFENFREAPLLLEVLTKLVLEPDIVIVEGHGIAHPRKLGVASHVGLALDHPTIGVGGLWPSGCGGSASRFPAVSGRVARGAHTALRLAHNGDVVGHELYTRPDEPPVYVSPGHRVTVDEASSIVLRAAPWHRMPEPLHLAMVAARRSRDEARRG